MRKSSRDHLPIFIIVFLGFVALTGYFVIHPTALHFRPTADPTANWKTYRYRYDESLFSIKYPPNYLVSEDIPLSPEANVSIFREDLDLPSWGIVMYFIPRDQLRSSTLTKYQKIQSLLNLEIGESAVTFQSGDWQDVYTRIENETLGGKEVFAYTAPSAWETPHPIKHLILAMDDGYYNFSIRYEGQNSSENKKLDQILSTFRFLDDNEGQAAWQDKVLSCINQESFLWSKITEGTTATGNELKINVETFDTDRGCLTLPEDLFPRAQRTITPLGNATLGYVSNWDEACGRFEVPPPNNCTGEGYQASGQGTVVFQAKSAVEGVPDISVKFTVK